MAILQMEVPLFIAIERLEGTQTKKRVDAKVPPDSSFLAFKLFRFLTENDNHTTEKSGMQGYSTGLDKSKLSKVAKDYGIDLSRYTSIVTYYEDKLLEQQNREFEKQKS